MKEIHIRSQSHTQRAEMMIHKIFTTNHYVSVVCCIYVCFILVFLSCVHPPVVHIIIS